MVTKLNSTIACFGWTQLNWLGDVSKSGFMWKCGMPTELTNNGRERKLKEGVDTRGGPGVLQTSARRTQQLSNCAGENGH